MAGLRRSGVHPASLALLVLPCLGGCLETGDFGRVKASAWNDAVLATGAVAAASRGEAVSTYPFTDDETELRDRAWRFLVPAGGRRTLDRALAELVATRILPASAAAPERRRYGDELLDAHARSPVSLYRRLSDDIAADLRLIDPFAAVAARMFAADRVRARAMGHLSEPSRSDVADAAARIAENRCLVAWVSEATRFRIGSYRNALERLAIAVPGPDAVPTERVLARFAAARGELDRFDARAFVDLSCLSPAPLGQLVGDALVTKG